MKITLKGYIKNKTTKEQQNFNTPAIKTKNKISYFIDNEKYTLTILSPTKLILLRESSQIKNIMYFEQNKQKLSQYIVKSNNLTLEINLKTLNIVIKENNINIIYLVVDSNNIYEYNIEMSD